MLNYFLSIIIEDFYETIIDKFKKIELDQPFSENIIFNINSENDFHFINKRIIIRNLSGKFIQTKKKILKTIKKDFRNRILKCLMYYSNNSLKNKNKIKFSIYNILNNRINIIISIKIIRKKTNEKKFYYF